MIRQYLDMARGVDATFPDDMDWMLDLGDQIEQAMTRDVPPAVACHCDLLSENFILEPGGRMWVIDWEYGGMTDPYFDLGDFCVEHPLSDEEERSIITRYCGSFREDRYAQDDAAQDRRRPVVEHLGHGSRCVSRRSTSISTSTAWAGWRRLRANAAHPGFASWLATV